MNPKIIKNWTIPAVARVTPNRHGVFEGGDVSWFPRLMGGVISHRRIHNRWEATKEGECGISESIDIMSSRIEKVEVSESIRPTVLVHTVSGSVYKLEGEPRPSFLKHIRAFGIEPGPNAVAELVERLTR